MNLGDEIMPNLMKYDGVIELARRLVGENPGNLTHSVDAYLTHLGDSYRIGWETVTDIINRNASLKGQISSERVALACGLHDIGRPLNADQSFHELRGAQFVEERGLELGVSDSVYDVFMIAQMIRPHFVVAEQYADPANAEMVREFEDTHPHLLVPTTWQEAVVVFADLSNNNGRRISYEDRIKDIQTRYSPGTKWSESNPSLARALETGLPRVREICERVERLRQGESNPVEIGRYFCM